MQAACANPFNCHKKHKTCKKVVQQTWEGMAYQPRFLQGNPVGWARYMVFYWLGQARYLRQRAERWPYYTKKERHDLMMQADRCLRHAIEERKALMGRKKAYPDMPGKFRFDDPAVMAHYGKNHPQVVSFHLAVRKAGHKPDHPRTAV